MMRSDDRRDDAARALDTRIAAFIANGDRDEAAFEHLALEVFAYQFERNAPYRRHCERMGRTPSGVARWSDIPPVPTSAFATVRLACFGPERTALTFVSSGTTSAGAAASKHELDAAYLYEASLWAHWRSCVVPDSPSMPIFAFGAPDEEAPHSSLAYMMSRLVSMHPEGRFFVHDGALDHGEAYAALAGCDEPVILFGTAIAFVHFFDRCRIDGKRFELPEGSRVVETGGFKGWKREVTREALYEQFTEILSVPRDACVSEYGMCELGSQWYDANLRDMLERKPPRRDVKIGPAWARIRIVDPVTAESVPDGEPGLIQCFDLSNRGSVAAILTGDVGKIRDGGFEWLGRSHFALPKGCSIAADELLETGR
ncbi:MAG TPA: hypothetical protein VEJ20_04780 [Candidatus Eremiobacteraceae bacterium]|nr:hypothetical protein [Candidatus Eremiobacteraceae bacterium]